MGYIIKKICEILKIRFSLANTPIKDGNFLKWPDNFRWFSRITPKILNIHFEASRLKH